MVSMLGANSGANAFKENFWLLFRHWRNVTVLDLYKGSYKLMPCALLR